MKKKSCSKTSRISPLYDFAEKTFSTKRSKKMISLFEKTAHLEIQLVRERKHVHSNVVENVATDITEQPMDNVIDCKVYVHRHNNGIQPIVRNIV